MPSFFQVVAVIGLLLAALVPAAADCGDTAQDRLVHARERMHPGLSQSELKEIYRWLLNATSSCRTNGDLWYFRGLLAQKLVEKQDIPYAFGKAIEYKSALQQQNFDPFFSIDRKTLLKDAAPAERYALLVGIDKFENSDAFLRYGASDARTLGKFLEDSAGFAHDHVTILTNEDATTEKIRETFGKIRVQAKANDLVVIYFSTHGKMREDDPTGLSYVLTYDTNEKNAGTTFATSLAMVELAELGRWTLAHDYILLLDTCLSGAAHAQITGNGLKPLDGLRDSGNRIVISASQADEKSYEDDRTRHGYFTRFLLEALSKDKASRSLGSLYDYLQAHVPVQVSQDQQKAQHPVMQDFGNGSSIILGRPAAAIATTKALS